MFRKPCASGVSVGGMLFPPLKPSLEEEDYYTGECGVTWRRSKRGMKLAWSLCELAIWEWQIPWQPECSRGRSHRFVELPWFMLKVRILFANYRYFIFYSWLNIPKRHATWCSMFIFDPILWLKNIWAVFEQPREEQLVRCLPQSPPLLFSSKIKWRSG